MTVTPTMGASIQQSAWCSARPCFQAFRVIATGWLPGTGRRVATRIPLARDGLPGKSFSCHHRFLGQAHWAVDAVGRVVLGLVLDSIPDHAPILVALNDTLNRNTGQSIWAAGVDHDPLLSTAKRAVFSFGQDWVVLSV